MSVAACYFLLLPSGCFSKEQYTPPSGSRLLEPSFFALQGPPGYLGGGFTGTGREVHEGERKK